MTIPITYTTKKVRSGLDSCTNLSKLICFQLGTQPSHQKLNG